MCPPRREPVGAAFVLPGIRALHQQQPVEVQERVRQQRFAAKRLELADGLVPSLGDRGAQRARASAMVASTSAIAADTPSHSHSGAEGLGQVLHRQAERAERGVVPPGQRLSSISRER